MGSTICTLSAKAGPTKQTKDVGISGRDQKEKLGIFLLSSRLKKTQ
jgi:hypothetical protein